MSVISVESNIRDFKKAIKKIGTKQMPFAIATALTSTAVAVKIDVTNKIKGVIDSPTAFTIRSVSTSRAVKRKLISRIFIKRIQEKYLEWSVFGGNRRPKKVSEAVPFNFKLNRFGNIQSRKSGRIRKILQRKNTFEGTVKGISGIWQRGNVSKRGKFTQQRVSRSNSVRLIIAYEKSVQYNATFDFFDIVHDSIKRRYVNEFKISVKNTFRTMRR